MENSRVARMEKIWQESLHGCEYHLPSATLLNRAWSALYLLLRIAAAVSKFCTEIWDMAEVTGVMGTRQEAMLLKIEKLWLIVFLW